MIVYGVAGIINWAVLRKSVKVSAWLLVSSILSLIFGILVVGSEVLQLAFDLFVVYMSLIWMIVMGISRIAFAVHVQAIKKEVKKYTNLSIFGGAWWVDVILGILSIVIGIVGFFVPAAVATIIGILFAISIIVAGFQLIIEGNSSWMIIEVEERGDGEGNVETQTIETEAEPVDTEEKPVEETTTQE